MARDETARDSESETPLPGPRSPRGRAGPQSSTVAGAEAVGDDANSLPQSGTPERPDAGGAPEVADGH